MPFKKKILIVSDFDGTCYDNKLYQDNINRAKEQEFESIAEFKTELGSTSEQVKNKILSIKQERNITSSQVVISILGHENWGRIRVTTNWYSLIRDQCNINMILMALPKNCKLVIASHTCQRLIRFALNMNNDYFHIYGSQELGCYKPDLNFFKRICEFEKVHPSQCIYIGDRIEYDIFPAKKSGYMGAILTQGKVVEIITVLSNLIRTETFSSFKSLVTKMSLESLTNLNNNYGDDNDRD